MTPERTTRRRVLTVAGSAVAVSLAGCSGPGQASGTSGPDGDTTPETGTTETRLTPETRTTEAETTRAETTTHGDHAHDETTSESANATSVGMITDNKGSYFDPKGLLVEPGTTVTFVNESGSHATAAYHPENGDRPLRVPKDTESWDSGLFTEQGKTFDVTFEVEGVYDYYCAPHEVLGMVGRIVVGEPQGGPATQPPEELPPAARENLPSIAEIRENGTVAGP